MRAQTVQRGRTARQQRQLRAIERAVARRMRSAEAQEAVLDARLGTHIGALRERHRLWREGR